MKCLFGREELKCLMQFLMNKCRVDAVELKMDFYTHLQQIGMASGARARGGLLGQGRGSRHLFEKKDIYMCIIIYIMILLIILLIIHVY